MREDTQYTPFDLERADALVLFGITGDLARKMLLPALYHLTARGDLTVPVVGVASTGWDDAALRAHARQAVTEAVPDADPAVLDRLADRLSMVSGDITDDATFTGLRTAVEGSASSRTTWPSRPSCSPPWPPRWRGPASTARRASSWRSRSGTTRPRHGSSRTS